MTNSNAFFSSCVDSIKSHPLFPTTDDVNKSILKNSPTYKFTLQTAGEIKSLGFDESEVLEFLSCARQKQHMRFIQAVNSLNQGLLSSFDKSHAKGLVTLFVGGKTGVRTQTMLKSITSARVGLEHNQSALISNCKFLLDLDVGMGAAVSKNSNSVGERGYMQLLGITQSEGFGHNRIVHLNLNHNFVLKFLGLIEKLTPAQLESARAVFRTLTE